MILREYIRSAKVLGSSLKDGAVTVSGEVVGGRQTSHCSSHRPYSRWAWGLDGGIEELPHDMTWHSPLPMDGYELTLLAISVTVFGTLGHTVGRLWGAYPSRS